MCTCTCTRFPTAWDPTGEVLLLDGIDYKGRAIRVRRRQPRKPSAGKQQAPQFKPRGAKRKAALATQEDFPGKIVGKWWENDGISWDFFRKMWELMGFHADEKIEFQETWYFNVFQQAQWVGLEGILRLKALVHGLSMKILWVIPMSRLSTWSHHPFIQWTANQMARRSWKWHLVGYLLGYPPPIETASQVEANRSRRVWFSLCLDLWSPMKLWMTFSQTDIPKKMPKHGDKKGG